MILNYFKRFNHIHLRPLIQTLSIANRSIIIKSECYFSLDRKVTKRSRLHLVRYSASCVRCRLWTRYAQTAQPPGAHYGCFALRSPDEAFRRTLCVLLRLPILPVKSASFCSIRTGIGHPKRKHSFLEKASADERPRRGKTKRLKKSVVWAKRVSDFSAKSFTGAVKPVKPWSFDYFSIKGKVGSIISIFNTHSVPSLW